MYTTGYKRGEVRTVDAAMASGGSSALLRRFTPGVLRATDRPLDVAIEGEGFFAFTTADGSPAYSRDGQLHVDAEGCLVNARGWRTDPPVQLTMDVLDVVIDAEGHVLGRCGSDPDTTVQFGQLQLVHFLSPDALELTCGNVLRPTPAAGTKVCGFPGRQGLGELRQGFLEGSNVQLLEELVQLHVLERNERVLLDALAGRAGHATSR